jgi:hypothetical protein
LSLETTIYGLVFCSSLFSAEKNGGERVLTGQTKLSDGDQAL